MNLIRKIFQKILKKACSKFLKDQEAEFKHQISIYASDPFARYDLQTFYIINKVLQADSNTIDVGAHVGEVLEKMIFSAPNGKHFAFEPLPHLYTLLNEKYGNSATIYPFALSDRNDKADFNYVVSNPFYSGLREQVYPGEETIEVINVDIRKLDDIIQPELPIDLIKIDVEGAEYLALKGAKRILERWKPVIIYEQGLGSAEYYDTRPGEFFDYLASFGYCVSLMDYFIAGLEPFSKEEYCLQFQKRYNYYFIAYYPGKTNLATAASLH